jgi:isopentenyldiphosphate isomerase
VDEGPFDLNPEEVDSVAWYTPSALREALQAQPLLFASTVPLIFTRLHGELAT